MLNKPMKDFDSTLLSQHIFPYVGDYQFRYIAGVDKTFYKAYTSVFPTRETYYNVDTLDHAKLCFKDICLRFTREEEVI
jgi:hypothetical protein